MAIRTGKARWEGGFQDGGGTVGVGSGAFDALPYSASGRFEDGTGTNPEELIGAAHASCFSMALSLALNDAGHSPESIDTDVKVGFVKSGEGFAINRLQITTRASVPGIDDAAFQQIAQGAKEGCPISKALAAVPEITLDATLE